MNWEHFKAILWLRWRLSNNQWRKTGAINAVLTLILVIGILILSALSFFASIILGVLFLPKATPMHILVVWDVGIGLYLLGWMVALLTEIQRTEMLSLDKLLHLPLSLRMAFFLNYLTALLSLHVLTFLPAALGLCIAFVYTHGPKMLLLVPLTIGFVFMMSSITYQLQGWIASLMSNKRRQRSIIAAMTIGFVGLTQVPNVVIQVAVHNRKPTSNAKQVELESLSAKLTRREMTLDEYNLSVDEVNKRYKELKDAEEAADNRFYELVAVRVNQVLPVGWLPYSGRQLSIGDFWPALFGMFGMTAIGTASLYRAYGTAMKVYTGNVSTGVSKRRNEKSIQSRKFLFVERKLPWLGEQASAVATGAMVNLARAPEAKMVLIAPMIFGMMFFVFLFTQKIPKLPAGTEPFLMLGGLGILMFMYLMMTFNIFGMDRNGFRAYVLMPVNRRDILLGKNVSTGPLFAVFALVIIVATNYVAPVGLLNLLAALFQSATIYLAACCVGNWLSIYFTMAMAAGTGKPIQVNYKAVLAQVVAMFICPLIILPAAIGIGIEMAIIQYFHIAYLPIYFLFSVFEFAIASWIYRSLLDNQATLLQARETLILEVLSVGAE